MAKIFDEARYLGLQRRTILSNVLISFCMRNDSTFGDWFQNKFLRYEFDDTDEEDLRVLDESVGQLVTAKLNQFVKEDDVTSIKEVLNLLFQVGDADKISSNIGVSIDELKHQLSDGVDLKLTLILKLLKVFGFTVQVSS